MRGNPLARRAVRSPSFSGVSASSRELTESPRVSFGDQVKQFIVAQLST